MATDAAVRSLRSRAENILRTPACNAIRFRLDNVTLQSYMYGYIGNAIANDRVHLRIETSEWYDPISDTITFGSTDIPDSTIVHEATHAIIDATHNGKTITVATGEAVAYVAESLHAITIGLDNHTIDDRNLMRAAYRIAGEIRAFNASHASGCFTVSPAATAEIKLILAASGLRQPWDKGYVMDGIYEGPRRGLLGMMILDGRK